MTETALIVEVPESEFLIGDLRAEFDESASMGVPAHITVLFPFMPESEISESVLDKLRNLALNTRIFSFQLVQWDKFDTVLWLRPIPEEPFKQLTRAIWQLFPAYPPYGGEFAGVQPHLTVAQFDKSNCLDSASAADFQCDIESQWDAIVESTTSSLPVTCVANGLSLYVGSASGNYKKTQNFPFSAVSDDEVCD